MSFFTTVIVIVAGALGLWTAASIYIVYGIEKPGYTLIGEGHGYEIRSYESYIAAEVEVTGPYDSAINDGFRILAGYIFGSNTSSAKISMTSPVTTNVDENQKIAMTSPVTTEIVTGDDTLQSGVPGSQRNIIQFMMPSQYKTIEDLPVPRDSRIKFRRVALRKLAALKFSWYAGAERAREKELELRSLLSNDGITSLGKVHIAQYDPPFSMPILRRNEILIEIIDQP